MLELVHMEIKFLNKRTVVIKGKKESVLVNPLPENLDKVSARLVIFTNENFGRADLVNDQVLVNGPGEYEVNGIEVNGINADDGNTVYKLGIDGFRVVVTGQLTQELSEKRVEKVDAADVLITSTVLGEGQSFKMAKEWSKKWGVNYLIPMSENEVNMKAFLDAADEEGLEEVESLKLEKIDDLPDGLEIKLLKSWNKE